MIRAFRPSVRKVPSDTRCGVMPIIAASATSSLMVSFGSSSSRDLVEQATGSWSCSVQFAENAHRVAVADNLVIGDSNDATDVFTLSLPIDSPT